jgi:transposase
MAAFFARIEPCIIGMEICVSAHDWARQLTEWWCRPLPGLSPFVKPTVMINKNDAADTEVCETAWCYFQ